MRAMFSMRETISIISDMVKSFSGRASVDLSAGSQNLSSVASQTKVEKAKADGQPAG
jgi:hypothetical protein